MIEHSNMRARLRDDVERIQCLAGLDQPQEVKRAVQHPHVRIRRDDGDRLLVDADAADHVALSAGALERERQAGDHAASCAACRAARRPD